MVIFVIIGYIMTIGGYYIINYCWIFLVILSYVIDSYFIIGFFVFHRLLLAILNCFTLCHYIIL